MANTVTPVGFAVERWMKFERPPLRSTPYDVTFMKLQRPGGEDVRTRQPFRPVAFRCSSLPISLAFFFLMTTLAACSLWPDKKATGPDFLRCLNPSAQPSQVDCNGLTVKVVGRGTLTDELAAAPVVRRRVIGAHRPNEATVERARYGTVSLRGFNANTGLVYEITLSQSLLDGIRKD